MTSLPNGDALSGDLEEEFYNALLKAFHVEHGGRSGSTSPMKETLDTMHRSEETLVESQLFQALEDRLSIESEWLPTEPASGVTRKTDRAAVLRLTNRKETREKEVQVTPLSSVQEVHPNASPKVAAGDRRLSADRPRLIVKQRPGASTVVQQYDLVSLQEQRKGEAEVESVLRVFDLFINSALKQHCDEPTVEEELIENSQSNHHPHIHNSTEAVEEDEYTVTFSNNHNNMVGNEFYYSSCRSNSVEVVSPSMLDANVHNRLTHFNYTGNVFNPTSASNNNNNNNHIGSNSHLFYDDDEEDAAGGEVAGENSNVIISSVPAPRNPSVNSTASAAGHHASGAAVYSSHTKLMLSPPSSNLTSPMLAHRPAALQGAPPVEANPTSNTSQQREAVASFEQAIVNASQANSGNRTQSQNRETLCRAPSSSNSEAFLPPSGVKAASPTRFPPSSWQRFPLFAKLLGKYLYDNFFSLEKITKKNSVGTSPVNETIGISGNDGGGEKMTPIVLSTGLASLHRIVFNFIQERLLEHVSKSASGDPAESAQSRIVTPWWLYLLVTSGVLDLALAIQSGEENESSAASSSLLFPVLDLVLSTADSTARLFVNEQTGLLETLFRPNHPIVADKIGSSSSFSPGKVTSRTTGESTPNTRSSSVRFSQEPPLNSPTRVAQGTEYTLCAMPPIDKIHQGDCPVLGGASDEEGPDGSPTNVDPILCSTASGAFTRTSSGGLAAGRLAPERTSVSYLDNSSTLMNSRSQPGISARSNNRVAANLSVDHFTNQALFSFMEGFREKPPREEFRAIGDSMSVVMCTPERSERGDSTATPMLDVCASSNGLPNPDGPTTSEVPPIAPRGLSQLGQIERQMSEAKPALQFAVKLGALYATLDIDALMPLLPAHTEDPSVEESLLNVEPQSSMDQETATDSSKRQTMRGSVVTKGVSVLPSTFVALRASLQEHLDEFVLYIAHHYPPAALLEADTAAAIMLCISLIVLSHIIGLCKEVFFTWDRVRRKSRFFTVTSITESLNRTLVSAATLALKQHRVLVADWIFRILPNIFDASSSPLPPVLVADPRTDLLIPKMDSFPVEWLSGFVQVADTAKHLLRSGHHAPQALVDVTWHLAGLASYFMGMRRLTLQWLNTEDNAPNKLNDMLLLASHRDGRKSAAKRARADTLSGAEVGLPSSGRSNAKQEEEQMQKTHDETIEQQKVNEEKLTSYVRAEIIAPLEKAMPPILSFMEVLSQSFFAGESTLFEDLRNRGSAGSNSGSGLDEEEGEDSESHELLPTRLGDVAYEKEPNHFLELCVHYFLEILDILLESAQLIPAPYKPLSLCALCMSLSSHPLKRSAEADWFAVVPQGSEFTRSPPHPPLRTSRPHAKIEDSNFPTENNLGRIQLFISLYCHNTLLEAVNIFANGSANREAYGLILENEKHSFIELVNRSLFGDKLCCTPYLTVDTMWWPSEPFSITKHTARVVQHGQLISTLFIDRAEKNTTNCLDMQEKQCETRQGKYEQRHSERVFTSILTPLLDASNGVGAVVLSLGCERPKILTMNSINGAISSSNVNANHSVPVSLSGTITHSASAPKRRSIQRSLTLTKRGLWFRVHVLRTIAAAALPTDADLRGRFRTSIKRYAMSLNERSAATHYSKLGSLFSVQYSLLTSTFSRTYVRLIFLRIVQAFNSDRSPIHCGSSLATSFPAPHRTATEEEELLRLNEETQYLWLQYLYELVRTLRLLCWNHQSAHQTADKLSIPSVLARFFDKLQGTTTTTNGGDNYTEYGNFSAAQTDSRGLFEETNSDDDEDHFLVPVEHSPAKGEAANALNDTAPPNFVDFEDLGSDFSDGEETEEGYPEMETIVEEEVPETIADVLGESAPPDLNTTLPASGAPFLVPRLSLGSLGPPLYFASSGDTGAAQEAGLFDRPPATQKLPLTAASSPCASPKFEMDSPAGPSGLMIPKLSLGVLSPPLYYTSTGDTGAAQEVQHTLVSDAKEAPLESPKPVSTAVSSRSAADIGSSDQNSLLLSPKAVVTIPKLSLAALGPPLYFTSTGDTGAMDENILSPLGGERQDPVSVESPASPLEEGAEEEDVPAEEEKEKEPPASPLEPPKKAAVLRMYTPRVVQPIKSVHVDPAVSAKAEARSEKRRQAEARFIPPLFGMKSASPLRQKSHSVTSAQAKSVASTVFSPLQRSVSAELVLCVASLILERHSGLVQYPFTLSSLTQRHLPHTYKIQPRLMYATHRDPLGNRTRDTHHMLHASSGPSRLGPTAYHVMKSLQDFVHSPSNAVVRGLLKQWLFNEFGEKIRDALMAQTTAAQQAKETTSKTTRSISVSTEDLFRRPPDPLVELAMERSIPPYSLGYFVLIRLLTPRKGFMRHFEVSRRVGSGGYGSVMAVTYTNSSVVRVSSFVFTEHQLLRPYKNELTVKVIPLHLQGNECGSLPLVHAEILALLRMRHHPRVMTLLTFGCTGSDYFLVSPLYKGGNFSEWRLRHYPPGCAALMTKKEVEKSKTKREKHGDSGPSLLQTVGETFMQVLEAVSAAHQLGIRHGDLKAANIFIEETSGEEGRPVAVRLGDFGSCDSCGLEDAYTLYRDVEGGEARFVSGRWGSGSGTEAVQAPEVMVPKYRYKLFRDMIESENRKVSPTAAPNSGTATASNTASLRRSSMGREMLGSSHPSEVANEGTFQLVRDKIQQMELSVDVWSCGCLLYEMLTGRMLFGEARLGRLVSIAAWYRTPTDGSETATMPSALDEWERYDLQSAVGEPIVRFLSSLLSLDPLARPTAVEALYAWGEIMINHVGEKPNKKME